MPPFHSKEVDKNRLHQHLKLYRERHAHRTLKSFRWALRGLYYTVTTQRNFQIQLSFALLVLVLMCVYPLSWDARLRLLAVTALVLTCEAFNTALEYLVDLYQKKFSRQAMMAKDIAAGAVLITSINAALHGIVILGPFIWASISARL